METKQKIRWCFRISKGLKIVEPSERLSKAYIEQAKAALLRSEKNLEDKDIVWATITAYYSEYYALYSFLQRIGIKCENHSCSIAAAEYLLGDKYTKIIKEHKEKRADAQYFLKTGQEENVEEMIKNAKIIVSSFDELASNMTKKEMENYIKRLIPKNTKMPKMRIFSI